MVKIKPIEQMKKNFQDAVGRIPAKYKQGVQGVTGWKEAALKGQENYEKRMSDPNVLRRRARALERVSEDEWKRKASTLGAERIGRGIAENLDKWANNYKPYHEALASLELPARTTDPIQNVVNRVGKVVETLVKKKEEIKG